MEVMKDITNYTNIIEGARSTSPADDNVFVSFSSPRSPQEPEQRLTRSTRPPLIHLFSNTPSHYEVEASLNQLERDLNDFPSALLTPTSPNDVELLKFSMDCSRSLRPNPNKKHCGDRDLENDQTSLEQKLQRLSKANLIQMVNTLVYKRHPELLEEVQELIPEPNLQDMEIKLKKLKRNIFKSFPYRGSHVGSTRDVFCYRRVQSHVIEFKKECLSQSKDLLECRLWKTAVEYILMVWSYINDLPTWDSPSHNSCKSTCYRTLAVHFYKALDNGQFSRQEYQHLKSRLEDACGTNKHLQPCLNKVNQLLKQY